jgi:hypothetical protein
MDFLPPGHSAREAALAQQQKFAQEQTSQYNSMYKPLLNDMVTQYNNPGADPTHLANLGNFQAKTFRDFSTADQQMQHGLANRGLGQSGLMGNASGSLWGGYGNTMSNYRQQDMISQEQQRQRLRDAIMQMTNPSGAQNAWGQVNQTAASMPNPWADVGRFVGNAVGMFNPTFHAPGGGNAGNNIPPIAPQQTNYPNWASDPQSSVDAFINQKYQLNPFG